jgi:hypothetical protein
MTPKEQPVKRESTSIKIDPSVWKQAKIAAIQHDMELSELVEDALQREMKRLRQLGDVTEE